MSDDETCHATLTLIDHFSLQYRADRPSFGCHVCKKIFTRLYHIKRHGAVVHNIRSQRQMKDYVETVKASHRRGTSRIVRWSSVQAAIAELPKNSSTADVVRAALQAANCRVLDAVKSGVSEAAFIEEHSAAVGRKLDLTLIASEQPDRDSNVRRVTKKDIAVHGLAASYKDPCQIAKSYEALYQSGAVRGTSRQARQNAGLLNRYLEWAVRENPDMSYTQAFLSDVLPRQFLEVLARLFKVSSVVNSANAVLSAMDLLEASQTFSQVLEVDIAKQRTAINRAREAWHVAKRRFDKQKTAEQVQKSNDGDACQFVTDAPFLLILRYLRESTKSFARFITVPSRGLPGDAPPSGNDSATGTTSFLQAYQRLAPQQKAVWLRQLRSICGLYLALNGSRLSLVYAIRPNELDEASSYDAFRIVRVKRHKTARTRGPAPIVLFEFQYLVMQLLRLAVARTDTVFGVSSGGRVADVVFQDFNEWAAADSGTPDFKFRLNWTRKAIISFRDLLAGRSGKRKEAGAVEAVSAYLMHGEPTAARYYKYATDPTIVFEFRATSTVFSTMAALALIKGGVVCLPATPSLTHSKIALPSHSWCYIAPPTRHAINLRVFAYSCSYAYH